jgi:hypothetical protein
VQFLKHIAADSSSRAVLGMGLRPLAYWDGGIESLQGLACLSLVSVACCQLEGSATGRSLVQGVLPSVECLSVIKEPHIGGLGQLGRGGGDEKRVTASQFLSNKKRRSSLVQSTEKIYLDVLRRLGSSYRFEFQFCFRKAETVRCLRTKEYGEN